MRLPLTFLIGCLGALAQSGGNGTLYIGARPGKVIILDEATEKVSGEIKTRTGTPGIRLSDNRKRLYMRSENYEDLEIADLASRSIIDSFHLSEGNKKVRITSFEPDPQDRYIMLVTKAATKHSDHWEIGPSLLLQYDLADHKVTRTVPWPKGEEREFGAGMKFSPDGKYLYLFGEDIIAFDTSNFKEVDKWELSKPIQDGFGRINFGGLDDNYEEPGYLTGIFTVQDVVQNRRIMGIARVNLQLKSVDFYPLGPANGVSFALAPGRDKAYGLHQEVGKYEFWTFDLKGRRVASRVEFQGRPRMSLRTSTNGKLLYIFGAGNTIDVYEAATYKYLRTVTLDADMTNLQILPKQ